MKQITDAELAQIEGILTAIKTRGDISVVPPIPPVPNTTLDISNLSKYGLTPLTYSGNETAKLQAALDYAKSKNLNISFPANKTITLGSRIRFRAGTVTVGNGCRLLKTGVFDGAVVLEGATVRGLKIDGGDSASKRDNCNGVYCWSGSILDGNDICNFSSYTVGPVQGAGYHDIQIINNSIHDSCQYGINTGAGGLTEAEYCYNITVTGNRVFRCGEVGIKIRGTKNSLIANNYVEIPDASKLPWVEYMSFTRGIALYSLDSPNTGIIIRDNEVIGNIPIGGAGSCAGISADAPQNKGITVINNKINNCDTGIDLPNITGTVTGNTINGCTVCIIPTSYRSGNTCI